MRDVMMKTQRIAGFVATLMVVTLIAADVYAAGGHGGGFPWKHWVVSIINFAIFVGIVVYFAGGKIQDFYANQRDGIIADRDASKLLRQAAEAKFEEYSQRLDKLDEERKELLDLYHKQGEEEKERLVADAKAQVEKMRTDAELVIQQEMRRAIAALEEQAVDLAITLAEKQLVSKVDDGVQSQIVDAYVADLNQMDSNAA